MSDDEEIVVHCDMIDQSHMCFTCPMCFTKYNKNGMPSLRGKSQVHRHGSSNDLSDRIEHRLPHCVLPNNKPRNYSFKIVIDKNTIRK